MTVSSSQSRIQYTGDGVTDSFAFPYRLLAASHLKVYADDALLTLTTDYTVTIAGGGGSATVDTTSPVGNDVVLTLDRSVPLTQETDYPDGDPFPAESHENALDKLTLIVQQHERALQDVPRLSVTDASGADLALPTPEAFKVWSWDSDGTAIFYRDLGSVDLATPADLSVSTIKIVDGAVTFPKMQDIATDRLLGRETAGSGDVEEIPCTAAGRALLGDASASAQRTTLGLGTMATRNSVLSGDMPAATTSEQGAVERATDAEAKARTATKFPDASQIKHDPGVAKASFSTSNTAITADMVGNVTFDSLSHDTVANTITVRVSFSGLPAFVASPRNFVVNASAHRSSLQSVTRVDDNTLDIKFAYWDNGLDAGLGSWVSSVTLFMNS